ncbi:MAG: ribosome-associated translation inhibitor RaiA [Bacillota bacterium]
MSKPEGARIMQEAKAIHLTVSGKNVAVTQALREHAERRISKLQKYFDDGRPLRAEVVMYTERDNHVAEVTIQVGSLLVRGVGKTDDMYVSIDSAVDRIARQVRKYKTRIHRKLQEGGKPVAMPAEPAEDLDEEGEGDESEPRVVRVKRFAFKPMTLDEAILQMELLGHDFFVFTDAETDEVHVLYRRRDGNYGLIEPEY